MRNLKMTIQYDGSRYKGWQKQKYGESTIQYKIENILSKMTGENIQVIGCGRTDAGVHAENYIANFHTECELTINTMLDYLYEFLPEDIVVKEMEDVHERFHARYNAKSKTYVYRIDNNKFRDVFTRKYIYHTDEQLNLKEMKKAAEILIGTHDFKSFTNLKSNNKSTIRTLNYINILEKDNIIEMELNANGFLLNMVRIIVGTLLEAGKGKLSTVDIQKILREKKREEYGPIAYSKGLYLKNVQY
ncbi:tRNA pseudouridine synthase A [Clostridium pasteurianum DSM 525 = ATCC 6013]|uniref:tRNA pseudouridine synthase A n=1 Tax=Clostridium pasteurianum DSM 525 = ATCC 6013 TaxID=1262449 RepID=A0A0H3J5G4_CLOPA|nr:tRNA pseudouridine(38-40) synthase TruA [Clostridium pasteurianum]AJA48452.1 tRNA pseudouridine synthase A [Clostridium pasteurianum DSM 525 = ATCC 6013]AJA52440.1 tRNA pseudouridine synthase A [Clostridium pasteurianum DSM 525 = ATCC 6013]AOZ75694.1 pseudouridine synthase [Clostridium pasteurianum DSM 525 = ATCC 6013]AOZ79490.1 pseudouridine synthase [Clostridium pasteurianum]ELP60399.1 tRNA pseudouridine synthase A [Clostridium pasteurianum DSM 525 = ATCC 6013]